jgi:hypothetical protein
MNGTKIELVEETKLRNKSIYRYIILDNAQFHAIYFCDYECLDKKRMIRRNVSIRNNK